MRPVQPRAPFPLALQLPPPLPSLLRRCSTTPGALYSWLLALVRGSRGTAGVSPLCLAAAACERLRRTCPGELTGLSCADSGAG